MSPCPRRSSRAVLACLAAVVLLGPPTTFLGADAVAAPADPVVVSTCDQPLQFTYMAWKDQVTAANGHLLLNGLKCTGGGGVNGPMDLAASAECSPALRVQVKSGNTAQVLLMTLADVAGRRGRFIFHLPAASSDSVVVTPEGGASLATPNSMEYQGSDHTGGLDLAHLNQYQLCGDWSKATLDIDVDAIVLVKPDDRLRAERAAYAQQQTEAAAAAAKRATEASEQQAKQRKELVQRYGQVGPQSPKVVQVALAAPDIIEITIEAQRIVPASVKPYEAQPGDEVIPETWADGGVNNGVRRAKLKRGGKTLGVLEGQHLDHLVVGERFEGDPLLDFLAEVPGSYGITSSDDPGYAAATQPVAVYRKTMPTNAQLPGGVYPTRHRIYLKVGSAIRAGKSYTVAITGLNVQNPTATFTADAAHLPSTSVHVSQIGFRPDDPLKRAEISLWLGTGGAYRFPEGLRFALIDDATRKPVFTGAVQRVLDVDGTERLWTTPPKNYAGTAVYGMDFGTFTQPGTYRVCVDGIGCSYPFEIGTGVWEKAFLVQMKGLYNQRSGVEIGPPYSDFVKPRDFHPDDGVVITRSTYDVLAKGQYNTKGIPGEDTHEVVPNAWGGYHDAGDWNPRRVTHMQTTLAQLELVELFPAYFRALKLNIPATPEIPDIITEALFEIDCFRRLQLSDGGVPFGIESQIDPMPGEISWLSTQHLYVLAPNMRDSWLYAAVAARAAKVLQPIKPDLANVYRQSAVRAFAWAEADYAAKQAAHALDKVQELWMAIDARNLSALILYDLTGSRAYHEVFLASTCLTHPGEDLCKWGSHIQTDAAFLYARLDDAKVDPPVKQAARAAVCKLADDSLAYAGQSAFGVTQRERGRPMFAGFFSVSGGMELARAHFLTGKREYLLGAVQSCQFQSGCNPNNLVYTTGLGSNPVRNPLHLDARSTGQPAPIGLTVFGNADIWNFRGSFWENNLPFVNKPDHLWPDVYSWPLYEAYFDVWQLVGFNEYTVDGWQQNVFVWGYLAARPAIP